MSLFGKIRKDCRQFGLVAVAAHLLRRLLRPICYRYPVIIFGMTAPDSNRGPDGDSQRITSDTLSAFPNLSAEERKMFAEFLKSGCRGIFIMDGERLAGSAWIQDTGVYEFGGMGRMTIPENHVVFKNLFVQPDFRGRGIAGRLDRARLAASAGKTCLAFIVPENRYAIRNWAELGMQPMLGVELQCWWGHSWKIRMINKNKSAELLRENLFLQNEK